MSTNTLGLFLRHLALSEEVSRLGTASDDDLLCAHESDRGQAAFAELMRRHGPMVLRTCRRVLGRGPDAEDAFQATFILLACKITQLRRVAGRLSLGGWLHRVAYQTAVNVLVGTTRRRVHERQAGIMPPAEPDPSVEATWNEVRPILDAELDALPEQARQLLIACYLQGKTHAEAAAELGLPVGSLARRLERARELLAVRLARRGVAVSMVLLGVLLGEVARGAGVPAVLLVHTLEAAMTFNGKVSGAVSAPVAYLVKGALGNMTPFSVKFGMVLACCLGLVGAGLATYGALSARLEKPAEAGPTVASGEQHSVLAVEKQTHGDPLPPGALARLGTLRLRLNGGARSLVFTPDGKGLLTVGGTYLPRLWDVAAGKLIREFSNIPKPQSGAWNGVGDATLSPDGRILAIAVRSGQKGSLCLLETTTGKQLHEFKCESENNFPLNCAFSPDGKMMVALLDNSLELREVAAGRILWQKKQDPFVSREIVGLAFSADGKTLASAGGTNGVRLWDARTGKHLRLLDKKTNNKQEATWGVRHIAFSPDNRTLAVDYGPRNDGTGNNAEDHVYLWDVSTGKEMRRLLPVGLDKFQVVGSPAFSPNGKLVATSGRDAIRLWDATTGKELRRCPTHSLGSPVAFSPDGKVLATVDGNTLVRFWDVASGKLLPSRLPRGHEGGVYSVAFTPDGQTLVSAGKDRTIRWWDIRTGQQQQIQPLEVFQRRTLLSPDGTMLIAEYRAEGASAPGWRDIRLWDAATGKELRRLDGVEVGAPDELVMEWVFSPNGKWFAEAYWSKGGKVVHLWEVATGKRCKHKLTGERPVVSPDGSILATVEVDAKASRQMISFWEVATGKKIHSVSIDDNERGINRLALSPDGQTLAVASNKIFLYPVSWDKPSGVYVGKPRLIVAYPSEQLATYALAFSPDGRMLASGGWQASSTIHVWEVASSKERARFSGHTNGVTTLSFTANGRRLASGSYDTTTLIWDVTGQGQDGDRRVAKLSGKELEGLWTDLASGDAVRAGRAVWALVAAGPQAVSLLGERMRPAAKVSPEVVARRLARLIADLDSDDFKTRQKARVELKKLGEEYGEEECEPVLRQALAKRPPLEVRRNLQELLSQLEEAWKTPSEEVLRDVRAVEILEQIGTPDAQRVLKILSRGGPRVRLTREAQAALGRLDRKQPG